MHMIRRSHALSAIMLASLVLVGCSNQGPGGSPEGRQASVSLQDGKKVEGTVKSSSSKEITVVGNDNITRTIPMDQVKSVTYKNAAPAPSTTSTPGEPPTASGQPSQSAPQTKTYDLAAGTEITVRNDHTIDSAQAANGQKYSAEVTSDVHDSSGDVAIPTGSNAQLAIVSASKGGQCT